LELRAKNVRYIENKQTYGKVVISIRPEQNLAQF
jgi:hypothetical protein